MAPGAVRLDTPVGGVNPQAVRYLVDVAGHYGRIVWMPTHDSEHEVRYNKESRPFVRVSREGKLLPEVHEVIKIVAQHDLALATGHVTPEESLQILRAARAAGSSGTLTDPHQMSFSEAGFLTTRLSLGERPVFAPE